MSRKVEPMLPSVVVGLFLVLHLVAATGWPACAWGVDALAYHSAIGRWTFGLAGALLLLPAVRRAIVGALSALRPRAAGFVAAGLVAAGAALFVTRGSAVHLLGDGLLHLHDLDLVRAHDLAFTQVGWANDNAPLSYWVLHAIHRLGRGHWTSPEITFRVLSVGSGVAYLALAVPVARRLGRARAERALVVGLLASAGILPLFAGYAEIYALLMPALLLYLGTALRELAARGFPWRSAVVLGGLFALHLETVTLAPSLAILAAARTEGSRTRGRGPGTGIASAAIALAVAGGVAAILFAGLRFDLIEYLRSPQEANLLPLLSEPGFRHNYRLLSFAHLADVANQVALVAPAALLGVALLRPRASWSANRAFLAAAAGFPVLFTIVVNPEVGAFRDWDALSFAAVPLLLATGAILIARFRDPRRLGEIAVLIVGASFLHTVFWLEVNAVPARAEARFTRLLESCPVSAHARAYGWESLGSHYKLHRRPEEALAAFERAIEAAPDNPRHWTSAGELHLVAGRNAAARRSFERALELSPDLPDARHGLGVAFFREGDDDAAVRCFERVVARRPGHAAAWYNLGLAHARQRRPEKARQAFGEFLRLEPGAPQAEEIRRWRAESAAP